ncbi:uncharacterized protein [Miscanthus floridulus]|uniref:uncharacterized protein n=1 Tax=Miscanthus floridulus TaxID=154761 RepID=UPI00345985F9
MAADRKNPRGPAKGPGLFDDMLKKPCPYHQGPVKHTLKECTMLWRYYAKLGLPNDDAKKKGIGDRDNDKDDGFLEVHNAFMIFGRPSVCLTEVLTFEVVGFKGTYHAILWRPCYAKFMVIPNYTYLKLKMSGPNDIITIESRYEHAYDCDVKCIKYAKAPVEAETLIVNLDRLGSEAPESKCHAGTFEPAEAVKLTPVDPTCSNDQALMISATLDSK